MVSEVSQLPCDVVSCASRECGGFVFFLCMHVDLAGSGVPDPSLSFESRLVATGP